MKRLTCNNEGCGHSWSYKGSKKETTRAIYVACPHCRGSVRLGGKK